MSGLPAELDTEAPTLAARGTTPRVSTSPLRDLVERVTVHDVTSPFFAVLREETEGLERTLALVWFAVSVGAALIAVATIVFTGAPLGPPLLGLALLAASVFGMARLLMMRGRFGRVLGVLLPAIEISTPAIVYVILVKTQGPAYAIGSWVPAQLSFLILVVSVVRLRPIVPFVMGVISSVQLTIVYFIFVDAAEFVGTPFETLASNEMQMVRSSTLVIAGGGFTWMILKIKARLTVVAKAVRARDLFGKYRLGKEIAQGGMGVVVEAVYAPEGGFERKVAVKRIHPHLARDPRFVNAFRSEAALAARLLHPNIVSVFDFGVVDDTFFFAMEYLDGGSVSSMMRRARHARMSVPVQVVVSIGRAILEALHHAHAVAHDDEGRPLRVVHRDLSPGNVLLSRLGEVKIVDFGIARALHDETAHHTNHLSGKIAYMAPEQAKGAPVDTRADLFAVGIILHELLTAESLFGRANQVATLRALLDDPMPDLDPHRDDASEAWGPFLNRALARDVEKRFKSARAMLEALDQIAALEPTAGIEAVRAFLAVLPSVDAMIILDQGMTDVDAEALTGPMRSVEPSTKVERP